MGFLLKALQKRRRMCLTFKAEPRGDGEAHNVKQKRVDTAKNVAPIVLQTDEKEDLEHDQAHVHVLGNE